MIDKPLLLGEAPSRTGDRWWRHPLSGRPSIRICEAAGIDLPIGRRERILAAYMVVRHHFECRNVFDRWPGRSGSGSIFPMREARAAAAAIPLPQVTVMLGHRVAAAFGVQVPYYEWRALGNATEFCVVPHPSGLNRAWNDPLTVELVGMALMEAIHRAAKLAT